MDMSNFVFQNCTIFSYLKSLVAPLMSTWQLFYDSARNSLYYCTGYIRNSAYLCITKQTNASIEQSKNKQTLTRATSVPVLIVGWLALVF